MLSKDQTQLGASSKYSPLDSTESTQGSLDYKAVVFVPVRMTPDKTGRKSSENNYAYTR